MLSSDVGDISVWATSELVSCHNLHSDQIHIRWEHWAYLSYLVMCRVKIIAFNRNLCFLSCHNWLVSYFGFDKKTNQAHNWDILKVLQVLVRQLTMISLPASLKFCIFRPVSIALTWFWHERIWIWSIQDHYVIAIMLQWIANFTEAHLHNSTENLL